MELEWDAGKSARILAERGVSLEELAEAIVEKGLHDQAPGNRPGQELWIVRHKGEVWVVVIEHRPPAVRIVTAYPSRKWRKKYGP